MIWPGPRSAPDRAREPAPTAPEKPAAPCPSACGKFKAGHYACLECFLATEK